jgi:putative DNA primase/helicase
MLRHDEITPIGSRPGTVKADVDGVAHRDLAGSGRYHDRASNALRGAEPIIVAEFRGEPNRALSTSKEMRWGRKGSFSLVTDGPKAGLWFDHEHGRGGDIIDLIKLERDCNFNDAWLWARRLITGGSPPNVPRLVSGERDDDADELKRIEQALDIWSHVQLLRGTPAEQYLRSRDIEVPDEALDALAFHPACPWHGLKAPCLVGLIRDAFTSEPVGIHRTALTAAGHKIARKALGLKSGGAIKLSPLVNTELAIGEGIETTLSGMQLGYGPAWSVIDAGGMSKFPVLHGIKRLTLFIDNDESGAGQNAAAECKSRYLAAGVDVRDVMSATIGSDLNDELRNQGALQ